ncbi:hypothetical protein WA026_008522 [Henosepilachna vigintioctopunctata]|uniref:Uncharacterized protein n=1 Tax=Henosepilachna vigintioctopunctata TaxID=420089 RepID=A0AAW1UIV0_9CUCU
MDQFIRDYQFSTYTTKQVTDLSDLNIDLLNQQHATCEYKNLMHAFGFKSVINDVTRPSSKTCLDHFFVKGWNTLNDDLDGYILHCMITDHYPIMLTANNPNDMQSRKYLGQEMQKEKKYVDYVKLRENLKKENWFEVFDGNNINSMTQAFVEIFNEHIEKNTTVVRLNQKKIGKKNG